MKILVTGCAGFLGSNLVPSLLACRHKITGADDLSVGRLKNISHMLKNPNFEFIKTDVSDLKRLRNILKNRRPDAVFHLAANSLVSKSREDLTLDLNRTFFTTFNILTCVKEFKIKKILFTSSSAVYGRVKKTVREDEKLSPVSLYGAAKAASEHYINAFCENFGLQAVILRPANVVGPGLTHGVIFDFINKLKKNPRKLVILGNGRQSKPYIHTDDLMSALHLILKENKIGVRYFNLGVDTVTSVNKIAQIIMREMGLKNVSLVYTGGALGWKGDIAKFTLNLSKIHKLGWHAKLTSDEAVTTAVKQNL